MAAELIVDAGKPGWTKFASATLDDVRESLTLRARDEPDFWSFVGVIELRAYQAMAEHRLAAARPGIELELEELFTRVSAPSMWSSVLDQASFVLTKYAERAAGAEGRAAKVGSPGRDLGHGADRLAPLRLAAGALGLQRSAAHKAQLRRGLPPHDLAPVEAEVRAQASCRHTRVRYSPRRCSSGTTLSTKSSNAPGK